jgi:hypothetical protein
LKPLDQSILQLQTKTKRNRKWKAYPIPEKPLSGKTTRKSRSSLRARVGKKSIAAVTMKTQQTQLEEQKWNIALTGNTNLRSLAHPNQQEQTTERIESILCSDSTVNSALMGEAHPSSRHRLIVIALLKLTIVWRSSGQLTLNILQTNYKYLTF